MPMMHSPGFTRLLAPTDNRKIEFRDQTIRERHAGKTGQAQCALRFAHLNPSAPRQRALATASQQIQPSDVESSRISMANVEPEQ